jgi:hypothetical protein
MSKDRVRFFIGQRYFDGGRNRALCTVLRQAFDMSTGESEKLINSGEGFWITCRPSQFGRFMIYRNAAGITNGFMDLKAEIVEQASDEDYYAMLAEKTGIDRYKIKTLVKTLGYGHEWVAQRLSALAITREIDVAKRDHQSCYS